MPCSFERMLFSKATRKESTQMGEGTELVPGEVAQQLRAMAALPQDLGSILPPTWWLTKTYNSFSKKYDTLFQPLGAPGL